ncbi:MAG: pentapeptide repeat-containing protein, partial [Phormidesmis sp.]
MNSGTDSYKTFLTLLKAVVTGENFEKIALHRGCFCRKEKIREEEEEVMQSLTQSFVQSATRLSETVAYAAALSIGITGLAAVIDPAPALAENPEHVTQLLETGICNACDLTNADLTGAHLIGVDLRDADLTDATLAYAKLEGADLTGATLVNT